MKKVWIAYALLAVGLAVAPFAVGLMGQSWVRILDFCLLYAMLALGLNIVVGYAGLLDLGYIAFYAVGAYVMAILASPHMDIHLSAWAILPLGATLACVAGVLLGAPTLRLRGDYLAIVTLGFGEIVRLFMNNLDRPVNITNGPQGINLIDGVSLAGHNLNQGLSVGGVQGGSAYAYYYLFLALTLLTIFICVRLENSRIGRAWMAIREDELAAKAMGINTRNIKLLAFAMGASFGGVAGGLFASFQGFVSPESFSLMESVMVLCMVVLGGMGHIGGVILGAILLTLAPEVLREVINPLQRSLFGHMVIDPENLRMLLFGLALILVMLFRPEGLWPSPRRKEELHHG
ncbi:MAG TPA: high-affinity branched-chain amino acid ABC transporter permease LivM [Fluviicoccus sp.]|nr:high-affinity branched-chain amino acid ABC transporter permease LivM [Fluviicoccus sp.]